MRARALVAEDNDINFVIAQKSLRRLGFEVERARDGLAAVRMADAAARGRAPRYDLMLMDIKMPGLDGREAVREIREIERETGMSRVAIVALTANATAEDQRAAREAGVDEYLVKPFDPPKLAEAIERAMGSAADRGAGASIVIIPYVSHVEDGIPAGRGASTWVSGSCWRTRAIWRSGSPKPRAKSWRRRR